MYGVLNKCVSPPGKRLLRLWLLRPLVDVPALHARLDAVAYFLSHGEVVRSSTPHTHQWRVKKQFDSIVSCPGGSTVMCVVDWLARVEVACDALARPVY